MTRGWNSMTLGEICDQVGGVIQTGPFGSQLHQSDYSTDGIPVVMPKNIVDGQIATESIARVDDKHVKRLERHKLHAGDIVYGRRGEIGRQALVRREQEGWLCGTGCLRISLGNTVVDPTFLHYYLCQEDVIAWIANQAVGATLPNLNTGILRNVPVRFPALQEQRRIAEVLSSYVELIGNNLRRIRMLEEMARAVYRECFMRKAPDVSGASVDLAAVCDGGRGVQTGPFGSQLHQHEYVNEGIPVVMPKDLVGFRINARTVARVPPTVAERLARHRVKPGDVLYGRRGDIGRRAFIMEPHAGWLCGTGCLRLRPNPTRVNSWFLFNYLGQDDVAQLIAGRAHGATLPNLNAGLMASVPVVLPPRAIQDHFETVTLPMAKLIEALLNQNDVLSRTRDLVLPRLVSGQLKVSDIENDQGPETSPPAIHAQTV